MAVVVPAVTYVALSLTPVQNRIARECERRLSELLDCKVTVGSLGIIPFNRVVLRNVVVETVPGDTLLTARRLGAGVRLWSLVSDDPMTVNYLELVGMDARLWKLDKDAPLNLQPVLDALKPRDTGKPPARFDLKINTVLLRSSKISYNVLSEPARNGFDANHLEVSHLRADIRLPRLRNNDFSAEIRRMAFSERCGFRLENLTASGHISDSELAVGKLSVTLPSTNLMFEDIRLPLHGMKNIARALETEKTEIALCGGSHITPSDLSAFVPALSGLNDRLTFDRLTAAGNAGAFTLDLAAEYEGISLSAECSASGLKGPGRNIGIKALSLKANGSEIENLISAFRPLKPKTSGLLRELGDVAVDVSASLSGNRVSADISVDTDPAALGFLAYGTINSAKNFALSFDAFTDGDADLSVFALSDDPGTAAGSVSGEISRHGNRWDGKCDLSLDHISLKGVVYSDLEAHAFMEEGVLKGDVTIDNDPVSLNLTGEWGVLTPGKHMAVSGEIKHLEPSAMNLWKKYPGGVLSGKVDVELAGARLHDMLGYVSLSDVSFRLPDGTGVGMESLTMHADSTGIDLHSDYVDGHLRGIYNFPELVPACRSIVADVFPAAAGGAEQPGPHEHRAHAGTNDFTFRFTLKETERLADFFHLPLSVVYPVKIAGEIDESSHNIAFSIDAPYLRQGSKLVEDTRLSLVLDGRDGTADLDMTTTAPTKNGPMTVLLDAAGKNDCLRTGISWKIDRDKAYEGSVGAMTTFMKEEDGKLVTNVNLLPGTLTFNDSTWTVNPAKVVISGGKEIRVDGINVHRSNQFVRINGTVSDDYASMLTLNLRNFSLDYLFESLGIDKVMLGGDASGTFYASRLLSAEPVLETPGLNVKGISYNKVVLGDALVQSRWNPDDKAITLGAVIDQEEGRRSFVDGAIFPMNDSLDITFNVDHAKVGFMQPYMEAFASDITGYASGRARIWGNFKYIDLEGDVYAEDLRLKVNFTNTYYTATDSVHFSAGLIDLNGITIRDSEGHPARLNGWVRHTFFKEPRFEFGITDAHDFLSYNETSRENPVWYGKIYGNGSAFVKGEPGRIDINVDMATAPRSTFTFVLSDQEVADEYSFLTFRDKNKMSGELTDTIVLRDTSMDLVNRLKAMAGSHSEDSPSDYNISLQMRVTPQAQIVLVMDPVGGDRIRAYGSGHLRMDYGSANNDLKMYGTYTLDRGDYNFTLQDVIIKDFSIKSGSTIVFNGDPYGAQLNIQAVYSLNANLSDLDESFLQDKDLNRTNVPVHALMKVNGDIRQPEITFDLEFPTLTSDIYRKVRSIISTDDMMNRQIIYLLALNRFYTPEYMNSTSRRNELASVASSTISSQLSNLLGQISDNWNISPTFRSDKGDFSDVEVDVALSSRLLNNRLLFNGNFGYRDNRLNSNQFIGDFDLEYILDREGMWRLKAYNRYNDQNYYLRTAHTTQGVGVVLKRDFDSFFSFLKAFRKKKKKEDAGSSTEKNAVLPVPRPEKGASNPADSIGSR